MYRVNTKTSGRRISVQQPPRTKLNYRDAFITHTRHSRASVSLTAHAIQTVTFQQKSGRASITIHPPWAACTSLTHTHTHTVHVEISYQTIAHYTVYKGEI